MLNITFYKSVNQRNHLQILFILLFKYKICRHIWQWKLKYVSWNTFIKAAAKHWNVLCKSGRILQCSFEDNFNVILCKRYTCMRTQQLIIHRMKASTTQPPFYIVLNMMRQTPMRDDARLNVGKYIHSLLYLLR